jgi:hypothetical protein
MSGNVSAFLTFQFTNANLSTSFCFRELLFVSTLESLKAACEVSYVCIPQSLDNLSAQVAGQLPPQRSSLHPQGRWRQ